MREVFFRLIASDRNSITDRGEKRALVETIVGWLVFLVGLNLAKTISLEQSGKTTAAAVFNIE